MHNQSDIILVMKFVGFMLLFSVILPVLAHFMPIRRLSLAESILLAVVVFVGTLGFFKWVADKHYRDY